MQSKTPFSKTKTVLPKTVHPKTLARGAALKTLVALEEREMNLAQALHEFSALAPDSTRPFARELTSGTLRHCARLDWTLALHLKKPLEKLDAPVRAALRLCCYERAILKTPAAVAGNEYSAVITREKKSSAAGLITAIARRLPDSPRESPDARKNPLGYLSTEYSHPTWLVKKWLARFGFEECEKLLQSNNCIAPLSLRVNTLLATRDEILAALSGRELNARAGVLSSDAILVEGAGDATRWPEWESGQIIAQDEGAQMVSIFAAPRPDWIVVDACAAPGGKSTHLAQLMNNTGKIIACDFAGRLKLVRENAERLKTGIIETREGSFQNLGDELPRADLVLLDAPCSGTGTLRRRPDAKWKKSPEQLVELVELQRALLEVAAKIVKPGAILVYSTCSLESEENELQIENFLRENAGWELESTMSTLPHQNGCDGAFAARLRRSN